MIEFDNTIVIIPAQMTNSALPGHPMLDVNGKPLLLHTLDAAAEGKLGQVLVVTPDQPIAAFLRKQEREVLVCDQKVQSHAAMAAQVLALRDGEKRFQNIVILPSHFPTITTLSLRRCLAGLFNKEVDAATLAYHTHNWRPGQVALSAPLEGERELAYIRGASAALPDMAPGFAQIPIFAWRRASLESFVKTHSAQDDMSALVNAGLRCVAVKVDTQAASVDTRDDLEALRRQLKV